jgi:hypothetical protein
VVFDYTYACGVNIPYFPPVFGKVIPTITSKGIITLRRL